MPHVEWKQGTGAARFISSSHKPGIQTENPGPDFIPGPLALCTRTPNGGEWIAPLAAER